MFGSRFPKLMADSSLTNQNKTNDQSDETWQSGRSRRRRQVCKSGAVLHLEGNLPKSRRPALSLLVWLFTSRLYGLIFWFPFPPNPPSYSTPNIHSMWISFRWKCAGDNLTICSFSVFYLNHSLCWFGSSAETVWCDNTHGTSPSDFWITIGFPFGTPSVYQNKYFTSTLIYKTHPPTNTLFQQQQQQEKAKTTTTTTKWISWFFRFPCQFISPITRRTKRSIKATLVSLLGGFACSSPSFPPLSG